MLGAIVGDIIGSSYEGRWRNIKTTDFPLFNGQSRFTDDSVMTLAVAKWLTEDKEHSHDHLVKCMQELGNTYPNAGYGGGFRNWLKSNKPLPYNSWGNGSAMRVSPVGMYSRTLEEVLLLAKISSEVSHNHPEGVKGAQAIVVSVFIARHSKDVWSKDTKDEIRYCVSSEFGYNLERTIDEIRPTYHFDVSCQGSVPEAIIAYLDGHDFEETIRLAVSIGGDSDTIACMAGAIAGAKGNIPKDITKKCYSMLPSYLQNILNEFENIIE